MRPKAIFNWSTGKDSALALHKVLQEGRYDVAWLLTSVNEEHDRVSMHGVRRELLEAQAASLGIPLVQVRLPNAPTMEAYERAMRAVLLRLREEGATVSIFGDIFLEDLRAYREQRLAEVGLQGVFPLWQLPTDILAREVIDLGFKAITTCVNERHLDRRFVGRTLDHEFFQELPAGVDPCGENGEFHTFTYDGPIFRTPVFVSVGEVVHRRYAQPAPTDADDADETYTCGVSKDQENEPQALAETGFWYCDLLPGE